MQKKIVIVEDNDEIRFRFIDIFSNTDDIECIGVYSNAEDFISEFSLLKPDIVFMDIQLPGISGIDCIRQLKSYHNETHFIIFTIFENSENIFNAIKAGATGYLLKSTPADKLISSVYEILRGESPMSGSIAMKVIKAFQAPASSDFDSLSQREQTILQYLTKGYRYKDIAEELFISIETVRTHIRNIYEKLQVNSRYELLNKAGISQISENTKYISSNVKPEDEENCYHKLLTFFEAEKLFLKEKLSISQVAEMINYPVYIVSQTINKRFNMGFFDIVNHYRVLHAIQLLKDLQDNISIEGIGYQCGFTSRTAFYKAFKKETGNSPGEYFTFLQNQKTALN